MVQRRLNGLGRRAQSLRLFGHPVVDNYLLFCKAAHLLGQVMNLRRKVQQKGDPWPLRDTPEFRRLDADIASFHYGIPTELRDPLQPRGDKAIDVDLLSAHLLPHISAIKLHEAFADLSVPNDPSAVRMLAEARACLSLIYVLSNTALDLSYVLTANISGESFLSYLLIFF
jgi:hypothetical protein